MTKLYFDYAIFATDLYQVIPDRDLVLMKASKLDKTDFIKWVKAHYAKELMPTGTCTMTEAIIDSYEQCCFTK